MTFWRSVLHCLFVALLLLPLPSLAITYYASPQGSGDNTGSDADKALPGLYQALQAIKAANHPATSDITLKLLPGVYRMGDEPMATWHGRSLPGLRLEGVRDDSSGRAPLISGLSGTPLGPWEETSPNVWKTEWPYAFGYAMSPDTLVCSGPSSVESWLGCLLEQVVPDLGVTDGWRDAHTFLRRELVVRNKTRLTQVTMEEWVAQKPGSYMVDGEDGSVLIHSSNDPNVIHPVYAANARRLISVQRARKFVVRDVDFAWGNPFFQGGMLDVNRVMSVDIQDCVFRDGTGAGLSISGCPAGPAVEGDPDSDWVMDEHVKVGTIRIADCEATRNGIHGMQVSQSKGILVEDCVVSWNNWQGYNAGTMSYTVSGMKFYRTWHVEVNRCVFEKNYGNGLWFDKAGRYITIDNCDVSRNFFRGLFIERCPGPVTLRRSTIYDNNQPVDPVESLEQFYRFGLAGLNIGASDSVLVEDVRVRETYGAPLMVYSIDFEYYPGAYPPFGDELLYLTSSHNVFRRVVFERTNNQVPWLRVGPHPRITRCFFARMVTWEDVEWLTAGVPMELWKVQAIMNYDCPPMMENEDTVERLIKWYENNPADPPGP